MKDDRPVEGAGATSVRADTVETVNIGPSGPPALPHARAIIGISVFILLAFAAVTFYVLMAGDKAGVDAATKGAIIQTWNNLAIAAATFWVGSSLAGKMAAGGGGRSSGEQQGR